MMCLFPFEKTFYEGHGVPVTHVGHPIFDALRGEKKIAGFREEVGASPTDPIVALLPGSREKEIEQNLPLMLDAARAILERAPDARFLVPCANEKLRSRIEGLAAPRGLPVTVLDGLAREVARRARVALVTSGTATLELLFHEVPMVVLYRANQLKLDLARRFLLTVKWISLVNILADNQVVDEFVGEDWSSDDVARCAIELLRDGRARKKMLARLHELKKDVAMSGASKRAASVVLSVARATGDRGAEPRKSRGNS
jgi:lipid-A-disaccharide synthase